MQKVVPNRMVIYAQDIQNITGRSERYSRAMLQKIRNLHNKRAGQLISVSEYCQYTGLKEKEVNRFLIKGY